MANLGNMNWTSRACAAMALLFALVLRASAGVYAQVSPMS